MSTTTTTKRTLPDDLRLSDVDFEISHDDCAASRPAQALDHRTAVESAEYEWTTPLSMPGLVVPPHDSPCCTNSLGLKLQEHDDDLIASEDGDIVSACQFPGGLNGEPPCP